MHCEVGRGGARDGSGAVAALVLGSVGFLCVLQNPRDSSEVFGFSYPSMSRLSSLAEDHCCYNSGVKEET